MRKTTVQFLTVVSLFSLSACSGMQNDPGRAVHGLDKATPRAITSQGLQRHVYVSAGLGASKLEPDVSEVPGTEVADSSDTGMQLALGVDLSESWSLEGHMAQLGEAGVASNSATVNNGSISYATFGVSGLYYMGGARNRFKRYGAKAYLRGGVGILQNAADDNVLYEQDNSLHMLLGAGAEITHRSGLGLRGELISYEGDAGLVQLGLLYRFGQRERERQPMLVEAETTPAEVARQVEEPAPTIEPLVPPVAAVAISDSDRDGVADGNDRCPGTGADLVVDERGCPIYDGTLEGVNFHTNSANLTVNAMSILDEVVNTLNRFPEVMVEVTAHTDSIGDAGYNQRLSERRSEAVVTYLVSNGINRDRLRASAFGESRPIADNQLETGRAKNRRVELSARRY